ncbi:MAG: Mov34/MPN/PAD-1 family protein [Candidatus Bathyarchaeia archaeon]
MGRKSHKMVRIHKDALATMIFSTVEAYPREVAGILFGKNGCGDSYGCLLAFPLQVVKRRGDSGLVWQPRLLSRVERLQSQLMGLEFLGMFHSHTRIGKYPYHDLYPSDVDVESWKDNNYPLELIIGSSLRRKKKNMKLHNLRDGTLSMSLGRFDFKVRGFINPEDPAPTFLAIPQ